MMTKLRVSVLAFMFVALAGLTPSTVVADQLEERLELLIGRSAMVSSESRIAQVVVVDPTIADAVPVGTTQVVIFAKKLGTTDVVFQHEDGTAKRIEVEVVLDNDSLQGHLDRLFGLGVVVDAQDGVLVLTGMLDNTTEAEQLETFMSARGLEYVDMTRIPGLQQVQLKVRIAEVSREALRNLAFSAVVGGSSVFGGFQPGADPGGSFNPVGIRPKANTSISPSDYVYQDGANMVTSAATLFGGVPAADLSVYLNALKQNNYIRILAEPNLTAISGEEATFLVGGEFPIPVVQGTSVGTGASITIEYKEVGIRLSFRPEVLGENRIRLQVSPEVSDLSETFGGVNIQGFKVPGVLTRRSSTTVELASGQTFAMAGLLQTKTEAQVAAVPLLSDLPIIGPLFRSVRYLERKTELVVLVTASLVEPIDAAGDEPVPGFLHERPDDWQLFMQGRLQGSVIAPLPPALARTLQARGIDKLKGPGAWVRFDDRPNPPRPDPPVLPMLETATRDPAVEADA